MAISKQKDKKFHIIGEVTVAPFSLLNNVMHELKRGIDACDAATGCFWSWRSSPDFYSASNARYISTGDLLAGFVNSTMGGLMDEKYEREIWEKHLGRISAS